MNHVLELCEDHSQKNAITHLYVQDGILRVTYHLDNEYESYGEKSHYYNSNEVVDTSNIYHFLNLDYREKDFSDTLLLQGYFLVGEMTYNMPDYLKNFVTEFQDMIDYEGPRVIKRSAGNKFLVYLKLDLPTPALIKIKKISQYVSTAINNIQYDVKK